MILASREVCVCVHMCISFMFFEGEKPALGCLTSCGCILVSVSHQRPILSFCFLPGQMPVSSSQSSEMASTLEACVERIRQCTQWTHISRLCLDFFHSDVLCQSVFKSWNNNRIYQSGLFVRLVCNARPTRQTQAAFASASGSPCVCSFNQHLYSHLETCWTDQQPLPDWQKGIPAMVFSSDL